MRRFMKSSRIYPALLAMIFVNTKTRADELHSYLLAQGLKVAKFVILPRERKRIMNQVKNLDFEYCYELT